MLMFSLQFAVCSSKTAHPCGVALNYTAANTVALHMLFALCCSLPLCLLLPQVAAELQDALIGSVPFHPYISVPSLHEAHPA